MGLFFLLFFSSCEREKKDFNGFRYFTLAVNRTADGFFFFLLCGWSRSVINMSGLQL